MAAGSWLSAFFTRTLRWWPAAVSPSVLYEVVERIEAMLILTKALGRVGGVILVLLLGLSACTADAPEAAGEPETPTASPPTTPAPDDSVQTYHAAGVVQSITPSKSHVVIAHETIPGFMDAMTMPFAVGDTSILAGIQPGDSVRFTLDVASTGVLVRTIDPAE